MACGCALPPWTDIEPLAQFNGRIHGDHGFSEFVAQWTREFASPSHPTCGPDNVTIVEDTTTGQIVSSMCLIPQTWTFDGMPFPVGRPEAVGTDPAYRRRGLVRAQFDVLHAKSDASGHLVQGITGIPWYYRQFDYEYAIDLDGGRCVYPALIVPLKDGETEAYRFRAGDAGRSAAGDGAVRSGLCPIAGGLSAFGSGVAAHRTSTACHPQCHIRVLIIIETDDGRAIGVIRTSRELSWRGMFPVRMFNVIEGQSLRAVLPSALRWLKTEAEAVATAQQKPVPTHPL